MIVEQIIPKKQHVNLSDITFEYDFNLKVFDDLTVDFLNEVSRQILKNSGINRIPAVTALAFWLRKANIRSIIDENIHLLASKNIKTTPIGYVFHVCPSNVDTMFFYSLAISLLAGNKNILRVSKKLDFEFIHQVFGIVNEILTSEKYSTLSHYIRLVSYGHEEEINSFFSEQADARIIWGGDKTVELFKRIPTKPRVKDFYFADRQSFSIINLSTFIKLGEVEKQDVAAKFYNDSFTFDQKGCSSPQILLFYGNPSNDEISDFYQAVLQIAESQYATDITSLSSLKLNQQVVDSLTVHTGRIWNSFNLLTFLEVLDWAELPHTCGGGYFYFQNIPKISDLKKILSKKIQTITTFGLNNTQIDELFEISYGRGVDRIVPLGKALDFGYIWDGYNLLDELTSKKTVVN
jgi:hypothetical protein